MQSSREEQNEIQFSIINPQKAKNNDLDFSLQSLLESQPRKESSHLQAQQQPQIQANGSFIRDLNKIQQSVSYESVLYNIYESSDYVNEFTRTVEVKHQSTCGKTINNLTRGTYHGAEKKPQTDFKDLIVDFQQQNHQKDQNRDYYEVKEILPALKEFSFKRNKQNNQFQKKLFLKNPKKISRHSSKGKKNSIRKISEPNTTKKTLVSQVNKTKVQKKKKKPKHHKLYATPEYKSPKESKHKSQEKLKVLPKKQHKRMNTQIIQQYFGYSGYPNYSSWKDDSKSLQKSTNKLQKKLKKVVSHKTFIKHV